MLGAKQINYLDANRPSWRAEPIADLVTWSRMTTIVYLDIPWLDVQMWCGEFDLRPTIAGLVSTGTAAQKTAAQYVLDVLTSGQELAASDLRVRAVIDKALPAGAARTALLALSQRTVSHWQAMGLHDTGDDGRVYHLLRARNGN